MLVVSHNAPATFPVGTTTVTFTATDSTGNTGTATSAVIIAFVDADAPVVTAPAAITLITNDPSGLAATNANIQIFLAAASAIDTIDGVLAVSHNATATFSVGTTTVTFTATDASGNTGTATSTVTTTFVDAVAPVVTAPVATILITNDQSGLPASYADISTWLNSASATDSIDGVLAVSHNAPVTFPVGTTTLTFTATDATGNTGTATSTVTINFVDTDPPMVTAPAAISLVTNDASGLPISNSDIADFLNNSSAIDDVDGVLAVSHNAPPLFAVGTTQVSFTATDATGNTGTATSSITVNFIDANAPLINVPAAINLTTNDQSGLAANHAQISAFLNSASATDSVDGVLVVSHNAPATFSVGTTTVTFTATDSTGNTGTATSAVIITFVDADAPVVTAPTSISLITNDPSGLAASQADISAFLNNASAIDTIDGVLSVSHDASTIFPVGTTTVTFSATDSTGNTGTATSTVTIDFVDVGAPVVNAPAPISLITNDPAGLAVTNANILSFLNSATATDTVDGTLTVRYALPEIFAVGTTQITFSATDSAGNTSTDRSTITVIYEDIEPPLFLTAPQIVNVTHQSVVIRWQTSESATAVIKYGVSPDNLDQSELASSSNTQHNMTINGLAADTTYYFTVANTDSLGNESQYPDILTFTTDAKNGGQPDGGLLLSELVFSDANLASCVTASATLNDWTIVNEMSQLDCHSQQISDLTGLENFTDLTELLLSDNQIIDISPLATLTTLTNLDLRRNQISDINAMINLAALTKLKLANNAISDVSPLAELTALSFLSLSDNPLDQQMLNSLANLSQLSVLYLRNNQLIELAFLADLTKLTRLYLTNNQIVDVSWLSELDKLQTLRLNNNQITTITSLFSLTKIGEINLAGNNALDCGDIDRLTSVIKKGVVIRPAQCIALSALTFSDPELAACVLDSINTNEWTTVDQLTALDCHARQISDLTGIENLTALTQLDLRRNQISNIAKLSTLSALTELKLSNNAITDLAGLSTLTQLTFLSLSGNGFDDTALNSLTNLTQLSVLYLRDNQIIDLSALAGLNQLTALYLRNNQIVDTSPLTNLIDLTILRLNNNVITNISGLFSLTAASEINLTGNDQISCSELANLATTLTDGVVIRPANCTE